MRTDLLVADFIHELEALQGLLDTDTDILLGQGTGPEAVVKVKEALVWLDTQECCHVLIVGQGC